MSDTDVARGDSFPRRLLCTVRQRQARWQTRLCTLAQVSVYVWDSVSRFPEVVLASFFTYVRSRGVGGKGGKEVWDGAMRGREGDCRCGRRECVGSVTSSCRVRGLGVSQSGRSDGSGTSRPTCRSCASARCASSLAPLCVLLFACTSSRAPLRVRLFACASCVRLFVCAVLVRLFACASSLRLCAVYRCVSSDARTHSIGVPNVDAN
eukprot:2181383-Rhodomonas_salina.1